MEPYCMLIMHRNKKGERERMLLIKRQERCHQMQRKSKEENDHQPEGDSSIQTAVCDAMSFPVGNAAVTFHSLAVPQGKAAIAYIRVGP